MAVMVSDESFKQLSYLLTVILVELKPAFECLTRASNQIKKSKKFLKIMEFISEDLKASLNKVKRLTATQTSIFIQPNMKMKATMLDEYNSATNGSSAKSNLTNFIHVIQVFSYKKGFHPKNPQIAIQYYSQNSRNWPTSQKRYLMSRQQLKVSFSTQNVNLFRMSFLYHFQ